MISLTRIQKRSAIISRMRNYQQVWQPVCCICMREPITNRGHLHEVFSRSRLGSPALVELLGKELHAILCPNCHAGNTQFNPANSQLSGTPDTYNGIVYLLQYNIGMWGFDAMQSAVDNIQAEAKSPIDIREWEFVSHGYSKTNP